MTHRTFRVSCVALFLIVAGLSLPARTANGAWFAPQGTPDEAALRTLIDRYSAAYVSRDLDAIERLWSDKSPDLAPAKARLKEFFSLNDKIGMRNLGLRHLVVEGERASVLAMFEVITVDSKTGTSSASPLNRVLDFTKQNGAWTIARDASAESSLAVKLAAAETKEEREALLAAADPELLTVELRKELSRQGDALRIKANYPKALAVFEFAERFAERLNDQPGRAAIWNGVGIVRFLQGDYNLALELYEKALALCQSLNDRDCIATSYSGVGNVHLWRGNYSQATEYFRKQLAINEELGNRMKIAISLTNLGVAQQNQGNYTQAMEYHQKSQKILESLGDKSTLPAVLNRIGNINVLRGELDLAMQYFERSIALYEALGNKAAVANGFNNVGVVQKSRGDYGSAIKYYEKSLTANEALGNKVGVANAYNNIGVIYRLLGNLGLSMEYQLKSMAVRESVGDKGGVATSLSNLGTLYSDQGDYARALAEQEKALSAWQALGNKPGVARSLNNIGNIHQLQGSYELALEQYRKAVQIIEELGETDQIAPMLNSIGMIYSLQGDHKRAVEFAERSASLAKQAGYREEYWQALNTAGNAYRTLGQMVKASEAFREAISTIEALRADAAGGEREQQQLFEKRVSPYYRMVELLAVQGETGEALSYAERAKSRVLLDVLRGGRVNVTKAMTLEEKAQEQKIRTSLVSLNTQLSRETQRAQPDQTRVATLKSELDKARLDEQDFQSRLYAAHPELQIQRGEAPWFRLQDGAALVADSSTALLEYAVMEDRTYLFVLTRTINANAEVKVYTIPLKRRELATLVQAFREKLASHNLFVREPAKQAYDLLLRPAQALLRGKTRLIIVPDDALWELPFQALLTDSNRYLIERSALSYAPSLTVLREMTNRRKARRVTGDNGTSLLALGNPALGQETIERARSTNRDEKLDPLPEAEREVQTLARLYGASQSEVFIGAEAREDRAKSEAGKFRVLHFATHGIVNNVSPMYSHLVLSRGGEKEDGLLEAWELLNLDLNADLVVLSACETARGRVGAGEGMIGLSWALFVAGTPTTVVSQWKVDSSSTTQLMLDFHRNRLAANSSAQSLQKAMLKMLSNSQYKHPFYWAPFVVIGDAN